MRVLALVLVWELMVLLVVALAMRMAMTMAMGMVIEVAPRRRPAAHTHFGRVRKRGRLVRAIWEDAYAHSEHAPRTLRHTPHPAETAEAR